MNQAVLYQSKKTLNLAFPIILGEIAQISLGLIDMVMVGEIGYKSLAAASLVNSVVNIPFILGIGITLSVSQLVSMANGKRDGALVSHYLYNGFLLSGLVAVVIALGLVFGRNILFNMGQDPEVAALAIPYMHLIGWSVIPMLLFMALKQFADGLEYTRTAMIVALLAIPLNTFLNWLFIFGHWGFPQLGLTGAGWGTLLTRIIVFLMIVLIIFRHKLFRRYILIAKNQWFLQRKTWKELLHIGIPSSLQIGMESAAFAVSAILIGMISAREQAAHQIAISIVSLTFMVSVGLSQAGSIRVSNMVGRKDFNQLKVIGKSTINMSIVYGSFCLILVLFLRNSIPKIFTEDFIVVQLASGLLLLAAVFQVSDSTQAISSGLLRGIKDVRWPTIYIFIAYWIIGLPIGCFFTFYLDWGAYGIWVGFIVGLTCSALLLSSRFKRKMKGLSNFNY